MTFEEVSKSLNAATMQLSPAQLPAYLAAQAFSRRPYTEFMRHYIPGLFGVRNAYRACSIVGSSGYAQAWNYGSMLSTIVDSHNLKRFNK